MSISSPDPANDTSVWTSLKQAISASSGFQHWASQLSPPEQADLNLDERVQRYLRETLETLAYWIEHVAELRYETQQEFL